MEPAVDLSLQMRTCSTCYEISTLSPLLFVIAVEVTREDIVYTGGGNGEEPGSVLRKMPLAGVVVVLAGNLNGRLKEILPVFPGKAGVVNYYEAMIMKCEGEVARAIEFFVVILPYGFLIGTDVPGLSNIERVKDIVVSGDEKDGNIEIALCNLRNEKLVIGKNRLRTEVTQYYYEVESSIL